MNIKDLANDLQDAIRSGREKVIEKFSNDAVMVRSQGGCFGIRYIRTAGHSRTDTYEFCTSQSEAHKLAKEHNLIPKKVIMA